MSERLLAVREHRMSRMRELASALAGARGMGPIVEASVAALKAAFDSEATIILREEAGTLKKEAETGWLPLGDDAYAARLCLDMVKSSGRYTDDFEASEWHFVPMESPRGCIGVIGLRPASDRAWWNLDRESYLRTMAQTISIAVARELP